jgi:hypothetical protein
MSFNNLVSRRRKYANGKSIGQRAEMLETGERKPENGRMPLQVITPEGLNVSSPGWNPG